MHEDGTRAAEGPSVTTISAARWSRIGRTGSGAVASRAAPRRLSLDTHSVGACHARKLSAYLANERLLVNGSSSERERHKRTIGHDRRNWSNSVSPRWVVRHRSFPSRWLRSFVRRVLVRTREGQWNIYCRFASRSTSRRQSIAATLPFVRWILCTCLVSFRDTMVVELFLYHSLHFSGAFKSRCRSTSAESTCSSPRDKREFQ